MDKKLIAWLVGFLIRKLDDGLINVMFDKALDALEDAIVNSANEYDDMALPLITVIRQALNVPDND